MYADNHQIYHSGHDLVEVTSKFSESTGQATKWCESNLLAGKVFGLGKHFCKNLGKSTATGISTGSVTGNYL